MSKRICNIHGVWDKRDNQQRCPQCSSQAHRQYDLTQRDQSSKKFYDSTQWKNVREQVMIRDGGICQECKRNGITTIATIADHIVEIKDGGSKLLMDNLEMLCKFCHNQKTNQSVKQRNFNDIGGGGTISAELPALYRRPRCCFSKSIL